MALLQTPLVILGAFFVVMVLMLLTLGRKVRIPVERNKTWEEVARRLGGRLLSKEGELRVRFRWNGVEAALFQGDPVKFAIPEADLSGLSFTLSEPQSHHKNGPALEAVPGFYLVTSELSAAKKFFTPEVRKILEDLRSLGSVGPIGLDKAFAVTGSPGGEAGKLVRFVSLCLQLAQQARVFTSKGVNVVAQSETDPGLCQICGADLEGELVSCSKCATRHHRDCWEYTGVCSTYGCGERRAVRD